MKKLIAFLCFSALVFTSCDGDDNLTPFDPNSSQAAIVQKIIETDDSGAIHTIDFNYEGNKIINYVDSAGESAVFTYTGALLTRIDYYDGPSLDQSDIFTYNSSGLTTSHKMLVHATDYAEREDFTHNSDGTVSYAAFWGSLIEQPNVDGQGKYFFTDGEVSKKETYDGSVTLSSETYSYDGKNNPWKNVLGLNEAFVFKGDVGGIKQNLLTTSGTTDPHSISYIYNAANFPETSTDISALSGQSSIQYFYE